MPSDGPPQNRKGGERRRGVPADAPHWITAELIAETMRVWQPRHEEKLTAETATEILIYWGQLADLAEP